MNTQNPTITSLRNAINKAENATVNKGPQRDAEVRAAIQFYESAFGSEGEGRNTLIALGMVRAQKALRA